VLNYIDASSKHSDFLRDTLITSKGYWGYSQEQLEKWRLNVKFEDDYISRNTVKLILDGSTAIGFFAIARGETDELDHLWLLPNSIGKGHGNSVFNQVVLECEKLGIINFYIISDPDAEGFYLKKGAFKVGEVYSEPQKRFLPKLKFPIKNHTIQAITKG